MRKIEDEMVRAAHSMRDWRSGNTEVKVDEGISKVYLHGHHIATVGFLGGVQVNVDTLRRFPTNTTKSRLRALGVDVYTKNHVTYLNGEPI